MRYAVKSTGKFTLDAAGLDKPSELLFYRRYRTLAEAERAVARIRAANPGTSAKAVRVS